MNQRRTPRVAARTTIAAIVLSVGAGGAFAQQLSGEITAVVYPDWDFFADAADQFMEDNPGTSINIEPVSGGNDYFPGLPRTLATDNAPDITVLQVGVAGIWEGVVESGVLMDISDVWEKEGLAEAYLPALVSSYSTDDGERLAVNAGINWVGLVYYNKDMFEELGIEAPDAGRIASDEKLKEMTQALADAGKTPLAMPISGFRSTGWLVQQAMTSSCGTEWMQRIETAWQEGATPQARYTDPCAVEALERIVADWGKAGIYGKSAQTVTREIGQTLFFTETAGMYVSGSWEVSAILAADLPFEAGWFLLPSMSAEETTLQLAAIDGIGIAANSDNPELAKAFLAFLSTPEFQSTMSSYSRNTGRTDVELDRSSVPPLAMSQFEALDTMMGQTQPNTLTHVELRDRVATGWQEILIGQATAEDVASDLEAISEKLRGN